MIHAVLLMLLAAASVTDIRSRIIPNIIPILIVVLFLIGLIVSPDLRVDWPWRIAAFAIAFSVGFGLFVVGVMGGGDVKLFAALALFHNLSSLGLLALATSIAGAGVAIVFAFVEFIQRRTDAQRRGSLGEDLRTSMKTKIPYGVGIFLGQLWVMYLAQ